MNSNHSTKEEAPGKSPPIDETIPLDVELMTSGNQHSVGTTMSTENQQSSRPLNRADSSAEEEKKESSAEPQSASEHDDEMDVSASPSSSMAMEENMATIGASNVSHRAAGPPANGDGGAALRDIFSHPNEKTQLPRSLSTASSPSTTNEQQQQQQAYTTISKPDPPPSVVDVNEVREELEEQERMDDREVLGREVYMIDENRLGQQILQAALALNNNNNALRAHEPIAENPPLLRNERDSLSHNPGVAPNVAMAGTQSSTPLIRSTANSEDAVADGTAPPLMNGGGYPQSLPLENAMAPQQQIMRPAPVLPVLSPQPSFAGQPPQPNQPAVTMMMGNAVVGGRRKIRLRMEEETSSLEGGVDGDDMGRGGFLRSIRRTALFGSGEIPTPINSAEQTESSTKYVPRGTLTISWFEGTSSPELREHVKRSVIRKLKLPKYIRLTDFRLLDEGSDPPEEVVLCPFIPDGSQFLLRFSTKDVSRETDNHPIRAPESPSAAPSPYPKKGIHSGLDSEELADLTEKLDALRPRSAMKSGEKSKKNITFKTDDAKGEANGANGDGKKNNATAESKKEPVIEDDGSDEDDMVLHSEDPIEARLRQITELLLVGREQSKDDKVPEHARRQVVFTLANYFVLFLSLIAISAEIQARAPDWIASLENEMKNVADCSANQEALFECISRGDFAGLVASVLLWFSRSVDTKKFFLFGFETPHKLWTVVYESFVSAACWGVSYLFIRRGLNPDTRHRFVQKYWKDCIYGSLAGFNAAFMKQVLKNFIPQEAVENAMKTQQLKILSWLPHFHE